MASGTATFADLLRNFRDRAELTQEELAEHAGISPDAVSLLERGERRRPHSDTIARLAAALQLSAAEQTQFATTARHPAPLVAHTPAAQLPTPRTTLVGRAAAIDAIIGLINHSPARLVTLTGPGGVGKTRLALAVAAQLSNTFADGALFVPLASVSTAELVAGAIATVLGIQARAGQTLEQRLI